MTDAYGHYDENEFEESAMTEPTPDTDEQATTDEPGKDPSNTPIEELTAPLEADDDAHQRITLVNSSTDEDLRGANQ